MENLKNILREFARIPSIKDVLYRLPWTIAFICFAYIIVVNIAAMRFEGLTGEYLRLEYPYWQSRVAASLMLYSVLVGIVTVAWRWRKKRDIPGLLLALVFLLILYMYSGCFLYKTKGFVIWPWSF